MQSKTIKKSLMCDLTDKERREYGILLATTLGDMKTIEAEKKQAADSYKDQLAGMQFKADELSRKVCDGKEWRDTECRVLYGVPDPDHKQTIRLDTGATVQTERMTDLDKQLVLPLDTLAEMDLCLEVGIGAELPRAVREKLRGRVEDLLTEADEPKPEAKGGRKGREPKPEAQEY